MWKPYYTENSPKFGANNYVHLFAIVNFLFTTCHNPKKEKNYESLGQTIPLNID